MKKLLIIVNVDWFFISHRMRIAEEALKIGWEVHVATEDTGHSKEITEKGIRFIRIPLSRSGMNIYKELKLLFILFGIYRKIKPDIVHQITLKPIIYGSLVSRFFRKTGILNAISGLGFNFTGNRKSIAQKAIIFLMKLGFNSDRITLLFQNNDDYIELKSLGIINKKNKIEYIKGSGIDLNKYMYTPEISKNKLQILFPARILWDKGIKELKDASVILKKDFFGKIEFILAGACDNENKAGVPKAFIEQWVEDGYVNWLGNVKDMLPVYQKSDIVVLPSFREGLPKSLIEACAVGRPIVTTDAPGCKDCVDEGINGLIVPVKNAERLAEALHQLIINEELRKKMGLNSREKAEKEFDINMVVEKHLMIYDKISLIK